MAVEREREREKAKKKRDGLFTEEHKSSLLLQQNSYNEIHEGHQAAPRTLTEKKKKKQQ